MKEINSWQAILSVFDYYYVHDHVRYLSFNEQKHLCNTLDMVADFGANNFLQTLVCTEQCTCSIYKIDCPICLRESPYNQVNIPSNFLNTPLNVDMVSQVVKDSLGHWSDARFTQLDYVFNNGAALTCCISAVHTICDAGVVISDSWIPNFDKVASCSYENDETNLNLSKDAALGVFGRPKFWVWGISAAKKIFRTANDVQDNYSKKERVVTAMKNFFTHLKPTETNLFSWYLRCKKDLGLKTLKDFQLRQYRVNYFTKFVFTKNKISKEDFLSESKIIESWYRGLDCHEGVIKLKAFVEDFCSKNTNKFL